MSDARKTRLIREATEIFLRLRDAPEDEGCLKARDDFLDRGAAEREAYKKMLEAWQATETAPKRGSGLLPVVIAALLVGGTYFAFEPLNVLFRADLRSSSIPLQAQLVSGDRITLDATSAILDDTESDTRDVVLMRGAAFFEVSSDGRPFVVEAGNVTVEVLGTAFEVARVHGGAIIDVAKGRVQVRHDSEFWVLESGDRLVVTDAEGVSLRQTEPGATASWREDFLISKGMSFAQVVEFIDRRIPGGIVITDDRLSRTPIVGTFDLSDPVLALRTLAELEGARVNSIPSVVTVIRPR